MAPLGWKHHTLIQALLSRGPLEERELHAVFAGVTGKNPVSHKQLFNECLLMINKELDFVQFELRACMNQYDGKIYYGFVNNVSDEQSKLGTKYSVPQIVFYKAIIESIALDGMNQGCISNIEALNIRLENQAQDGQALQESQFRIPAAFKSFTISQKEKTLSELIRDRWLTSTSDGQIGLGVRSFLDLRSWFCNNDVVSCHVCNEAAIKAEQCPNEGCLVCIHHYCLKKFYKRKAAKVCPGCGAEWHHPSVFTKKTGEEAAAAAEEPAAEAIDVAVNAPILKEKRTRKISKEESTSAASDGRCRTPTLRKKRARLCKKEIEDAADVDSTQPPAPAPTAAGVRTRRSALR